MTLPENRWRGESNCNLETPEGYPSQGERYFTSAMDTMWTLFLPASAWADTFTWSP
jgi:hypothetical protein